MLAFNPSTTYYGGQPVPVSDFPHCPHVIELWENLNQWEMYYKTAEAGGLGMLAKRMVQSAEEAKATCDPARAEVIEQALKELETPQGWAEFILYLKRKLY